MIVRSFLLLSGMILIILSQVALGSVGSEEIRASVSRHLSAHIAQLADSYGDNTRIDYSISSLDPRLSMADCPIALSTEIKSQHSIGRINVKVSCQQENLWSLYVPANIDLYRDVVITIMPVAKGQQLNIGQLDMREVDVSKLNGSYFTRADQVIGMQAKRPLKADKPVISGYLEQPLLIKKGDAVFMTAQSDSLTVKISGVALMDGHKGQQISVRNNQSKRIVEGRVTAAGQVLIAM